MSASWPRMRAHASTDTSERKRELERELREIEAEEARAREERRKRTRPRYDFEIAPVETRRWDWIRDDSIRAYRITGRVSNRDECLAAGWPDGGLADGGMNYLFNTLSGKIVMRTGGGTIYIQDGTFGSSSSMEEKERNEDAERAYGELEAFLRDHPEGGDVTSIITSQRHTIYSRG